MWQCPDPSCRHLKNPFEVGTCITPQQQNKKDDCLRVCCLKGFITLLSKVGKEYNVYICLPASYSSFILAFLAGVSLSTYSKWNTTGRHHKGHGWQLSKQAPAWMVTEQKVSLQSTSDHPNSSNISTRNPASTKKECWEILLLVQTHPLLGNVPWHQIPIQHTCHATSSPLIWMSKLQYFRGIYNPHSCITVSEKLHQLLFYSYLVYPLKYFRALSWCK